ncbi:MAG: sugar phosphate isomerase/epimerase [Opitutaceae bacterium]|nr:sugar phosphate isomerase/epimerase [Opitutaceae bacterium]
MHCAHAFTSLGCFELSLDETLSLATRHQITLVELRALGGSIDLPGYFEKNCKSPEILAQAMAGQPVRIHCLDTSLKLTGAGDGQRGEFLRFLPWAEALGGVPLRVFDGGAADGEAGRREAVETIRWWQNLRAARGWKSDIVVETHDSLFTGRKVMDFLGHAPGVRILWDTHHTWRLGGEHPAATWRVIAKHVAHLHVKDSVSRRDGGRAYTYVYPGMGEFPMGEVRAALSADGFSGIMALEWELLWHPRIGDLDTALSSAAGTGWW